MRNRFRVPEAALFSAAWREGYGTDRPEYGDEGNLCSDLPLLKAWRRHSELLYRNWRALMQTVLRKGTWEVLDHLLERREMKRQLWLKPGGYLLTKGGRRRKRRVKGLRAPSAKTLCGEIKRAEAAYEKALDMEGEGFGNKLLVAVLALSGAIYGGTAVNSVMDRRTIRLKGWGTRETKRVRYFHPWPWQRSVKARLRSAVKIGLLHRL